LSLIFVDRSQFWSMYTNGLVDPLPLTVRWDGNEDENVPLDGNDAVGKEGKEGKRSGLTNKKRLLLCVGMEDDQEKISLESLSLPPSLPPLSLLLFLPNSSLLSIYIFNFRPIDVFATNLESQDAVKVFCRLFMDSCIHSPSLSLSHRLTRTFLKFSSQPHEDQLTDVTGHTSLSHSLTPASYFNPFGDRPSSPSGSLAASLSASSSNYPLPPSLHVTSPRHPPPPHSASSSSRNYFHFNKMKLFPKLFASSESSASSSVLLSDTGQVIEIDRTLSTSPSPHMRVAPDPPLDTSLDLALPQQAPSSQERLYGPLIFLLSR
jgi:hypothetical protein